METSFCKSNELNNKNRLKYFPSYPSSSPKRFTAGIGFIAILLLTDSQVISSDVSFGIFFYDFAKNGMFVVIKLVQ